MTSRRSLLCLVSFAISALTWGGSASADPAATAERPAGVDGVAPPAPASANPAVPRNIAIGGEVMVFPQQRSARLGGQTIGIDGALAFPIGGEFTLGPSLGFLRGDMSSEPNQPAVTIIRPAGRLSWGAPAYDGIIGASLDAGTWVGFGGYGGAVGFVPYLRPSFIVQWPRGETRPFLALDVMAGLAKPDELGHRPSAAFGPFGVGLTMGVAWGAH